MTVAVWCKINNAAFYAGTHQKPRLSITYDNGTTVYTEAAASTDWQLLAVNFTPTTTYGQITVELSCRTDAVGANAYVYFDDWTVLYPAAYVLNLGGMDLWANALPITPPIATVFSAQDIWTAQTVTMTGLGHIGNWIVDKLDAMISSRLAAASYSAAPTAVQNRQEMDANSTKLANLDATVSSRSTYAGGAVASVTNPVTVGTNNDKAGYSLSVSPPTAGQIADAVLDEDVTGHTGWLTKLLSVAKFLGLK